MINNSFIGTYIFLEVFISHYTFSKTAAQVFIFKIRLGDLNSVTISNTQSTNISEDILYTKYSDVYHFTLLSEVNITNVHLQMRKLRFKKAK